MQLTLTIPDEIALHFHSEEQLRRTLFEDFIIEQRQNGNISLSRAANLLNISYEEFFQLLGEKGLSFINESRDVQAESYNEFQAFMKSR